MDDTEAVQVVQCGQQLLEVEFEGGFREGAVRADQVGQALLGEVFEEQKVVGWVVLAAVVLDDVSVLELREDSDFCDFCGVVVDSFDGDGAAGLKQEPFVDVASHSRTNELTHLPGLPRHPLLTDGPIPALLRFTLARPI